MSYLYTLGSILHNIYVYCILARVYIFSLLPKWMYFVFTCLQCHNVLVPTNYFSFTKIGYLRRFLYKFIIQRLRINKCLPMISF